MLGQDALHRLVRWNVPTSKARVFPGFPPQFTPTVHLLQQKGLPGNLQALTQLLLDTLEPLRGSPGVGSNVAVPDGQIVVLSHTKLLLWFAGVARQGSAAHSAQKSVQRRELHVGIVLTLLTNC